MGMIGRGRDAGGPDLGIRPDGTMASDVSVIPLAIPFISGPGSIATVMILTSEAPTIWHTGLVFVAVVASTAAGYYSMTYSRYVVRYLGESGREIVTRIFGLILAVIAVQFVINGVVDVIRRLPVTA